MGSFQKRTKMMKKMILKTYHLFNLELTRTFLYQLHFLYNLALLLTVRGEKFNYLKQALH